MVLIVNTILMEDLAWDGIVHRSWTQISVGNFHTYRWCINWFG